MMCQCTKYHCRRTQVIGRNVSLQVLPEAVCLQTCNRRFVMRVYQHRSVRSYNISEL